MKLIYISGAGRSGSTLLERVLSSAPGVFGLGEFHCLWRMDIRELMCACGHRLRDCGFWSRVIPEARIDADWTRMMRDLEWSVVRHRLIARNGFDLRRIAAIPEIAEFVERQMAVLSVVAKISDCDVLINSSKAVPRAWTLAAHADPTIIHLRRACKDFFASVITPKYDPGLGKLMPTPSFPYLAMSWFKAEQSNKLLARRTPVSRLNYEAFASAPQAYLTATLGPVFPNLIQTIAWADETSVDPPAEYHSIGGNPDRYSRERIVIQPHTAIGRLSMRERYRCLLVGAALTLLCG